MAIRKMPSRIKVRRGTYQQWYNANPTLEDGEITFVTTGQDAGKFKVGDGSKKWRQLAYTASRFPEEAVQLVDQIASSTLPENGDIKQLFQAIRNYLKWETQTRQTSDSQLQHNINQEGQLREGQDTIIVEALSEEAVNRANGDEAVRFWAKSYTDAAQLATQTWLPAVNLLTSLDEIVGLSPSINYLCRVVADTDPANNGVYQAIAGWDEAPIWTFFSDNADWIDEIELAGAIDEHNQDEDAHQDIRNQIALISGDGLAEMLENMAALLNTKAPLASPALTGTPTAPTAAQSVNNTQIATTAYVRSAVSSVAGFVASEPVGTLYMSTSSTGPATHRGGTWTQWGKGKFLVGKADSGTFNKTPETSGATGGAETHTLTVSEMPSHTHQIYSYASYSVPGGVVGINGISGNVESGAKGGGAAHNNLPPYEVVYIFKKTVL